MQTEPFSPAEYEERATRARRVLLRDLALIWLLAIAGGAYMYARVDSAYVIVVFALYGLAFNAAAIWLRRRLGRALEQERREPTDVVRVAPKLERALTDMEERERGVWPTVRVLSCLCFPLGVVLAVALGEVVMGVVVALSNVYMVWLASRQLRTLDTRYETRRRELRARVARERGSGADLPGA